MDLAELSRELEKQSMLAAGTFSRVVVRSDVGAFTDHLEITGVMVVGDTIILIANEEAEAPKDPAQQEADKIDAAMEADYRRDDERAREEVDEQESDLARHLRMAEDQPSQERDL